MRELEWRLVGSEVVWDEPLESDVANACDLVLLAKAYGWDLRSFNEPELTNLRDYIRAGCLKSLSKDIQDIMRMAIADELFSRISRAKDDEGDNDEKL